MILCAYARARTYGKSNQIISLISSHTHTPTCDRDDDDDDDTVRSVYYLCKPNMCVCV